MPLQLIGNSVDKSVGNEVNTIYPQSFKELFEGSSAAFLQGFHLFLRPSGKDELQSSQHTSIKPSK